MSNRDALDSYTFEVQDSEGSKLGTAVLVGQQEALTCSHVVGQLGRVDLFEAATAERLCGATVEPPGNPEGPDDLALLKLDDPVPGRSGLRFVAADRGDEFHVVGFPARGKDQVFGTVQGPAPPHDWRQINPSSIRKIEPGFSGAAVWVPAKNAAVGIVTHRDPDQIAYAVTTEQIQAFCPTLGRDPKKVSTGRMKEPRSPNMGYFTGGMKEPRIPNMGYSRLVKILADGACVGQGFLLHSTWVVTVAEIVDRAGKMEVQVPHGTLFRKRKTSVLWPQDGEVGDSGIVLLKTTAPGSLAPVERIAPQDVAPGAPWRVLGYPSAGKSPMKRTVLGGRVGALRDHCWSLEMDAGCTGDGEVDQLAGAGVFVDPDASGQWRLLGVLGFAEGNPGSGLEVRSLAALEAWEGFEAGVAVARESVRWESYVGRVGKRLRDPQVRLAVHEADPEGSWQSVADPGELARELCFETDPDLLAEALSAAHEKAIDDGATGVAKDLFAVLMDALPTALVSRWRVKIPDSSANEVHLGVFIRVLAEFALAAAAGAPAEFHRTPSHDDPDFPRATHEIARPGELGPDLDGNEAAAEVAHAAQLRLALDASSGSESQRKVNPLIADLAAQRNLPGGKMLISPTELGATEQAGRPSGGLAGNAILNVINSRLARGTSSRRLLYLLAGDGDEALVAGLRRYLPELQIVTLKGQAEQLEEYELLLDALKTAFHSRQKRERSSS